MNINLKKFILQIEKIELPMEGGSEEGINSEKFWPVFIISLALFLMISFGPDLVDFAKATTNTVALSVTISPTLTFNIDASTKAFGTLTSGTPQTATSMLWVTTSNAVGYYTSINRASTTATLSSGSQTIGDTPNSNNWTAPSATSTAGPSTVWTTGTTQGLGFRVVSSGTSIGSGASTTCGAATTWWGTTDDYTSAKWSGISTSTSAQQIANCNYYNSAGTGQTIIFKVDVSGIQGGGTYTSSPITYTVLTN